jgi:uncharacterized membrane protein SirB2
VADLSNSVSCNGVVRSCIKSLCSMAKRELMKQSEEPESMSTRIFWMVLDAMLTYSAVGLLKETAFSRTISNGAVPWR